MKAVIVTIGDEILIGQITDTNSAFIAKSLDKIGITVQEMISIGDTQAHILETLGNLQNEVDLVVITGGLGPTKDDITKTTFCAYFEDQLIRNQQVEEHVIQLIESVLKRPASQLNKDQALVPSKAEILFNDYGTAPGMWVRKDSTVFVSLPGVPYEMKYLVTERLIPRLVQEFERPFILHKTIMTYGQGESVVAERIEDWENALPDYIKLAYLPSPGRVRLRLSAKGKDEKFLKESIENQVQALQPLIGDIIVGFEEEETIEVEIGKLLNVQKKTVSTAESCTGGKIAQLISSVSGSSQYFRGGIVSYATDTKITLLGVKTETIQKYSVVSKEVAVEMATRVRQIMHTDYAIATTGNAGPNKGDSDAELGTVIIALAAPDGVIVEEFNFGQPREKVIDRAVNKAFEILRKEILKNVT